MTLRLTLGELVYPDEALADVAGAPSFFLILRSDVPEPLDGLEPLAGAALVDPLSGLLTLWGLAAGPLDSPLEAPVSDGLRMARGLDPEEAPVRSAAHGGSR